MESRTKSVPYNNDAEMYVLGSILLENNVINQMIGKLTADDFYNPQNATIFKAMMSLFNNSIKIETVSVTEQLIRDKVSKYLYKQTAKRPMILPVILEINLNK